MLHPFAIDTPFIQSELDFHQERVSQELAAAEMRRRNRVARRLVRQQTAKRHGQRRNAPRTV
jgi:hypothetical protein